MLDHKLTIFYHTAKHLNTTKAAEILRLSQPAISKSIKELEKGLGITLFDREKGRLMLTPAGKYLLEQSDIQDELSCGLLKIIDIDDLEISRTLYAIHKQGTIDPYAELLLRFCESRNRKSKR